MSSWEGQGALNAQNGKWVPRVPGWHRQGLQGFGSGSDLKLSQGWICRTCPVDPPKGRFFPTPLEGMSRACGEWDSVPAVHPRPPGADSLVLRGLTPTESPHPRLGGPSTSPRLSPTSWLWVISPSCWTHLCPCRPPLENSAYTYICSPARTAGAVLSLAGSHGAISEGVEGVAMRPSVPCISWSVSSSPLSPSPPLCAHWACPQNRLQAGL